MQFLNPCNDVAFKRIFGSEEHKRITISFLNSILEYTGEQAIKSIEFLNNEQLPQMIDKKDNVLDVCCTDQVGNRYIVEIQVGSVERFDKRMVFYGAKTYSMQLIKGRPYSELMPVVTLAIVNFTMFSKKKSYKSIHHILDTKTHEHDIKELTFAFVELKKFKKKEHELVTDEDKWIYFMKEIQKQDHVPAPLAADEFKEACHVAERMTWPEEALNAYEDAFVRETDQEGGRKIAHKEGKAEGEMNKTIEIARKLLARGTSIEIIAEDTGLPVDEIKKLS